MSDKEVNQEEKVYDQKHVDGITKDLQGERSQRQQAQFEVEQSRRELESLKKTVEEMKNSKPTELASDKMQFEGEDDDFAKVKDVKLGFKNLEKEATTTFKEAQKAAKAAANYEIAKEKYDNSCLDATNKYANRVNVGLDFRTVYQAAIRRIGKNEYEQKAIFYSKNPGERLYKVGCEDPEIKAKLDLEENQELLKNMETRKVDKDDLTGGTKIKSEFYTPKEVASMNPSEVDLDKLEKSMKYWEEMRKK